MKIGIITFHWATNYGAVLQSYALQEALRHLGHEPMIINYKPSAYDDTLWPFLRYRKFMSLSRYFRDRRKEARIAEFRAKYLNQTRRFRTLKELGKSDFQLDALVTGSDQVLNESFLVSGEPGGSTAYFLDFGPKSARRIAYAASFGTTQYRETLIQRVASLVKHFDAVSARETTGLSIFRKMGAHEPVLVPDPTLLHSSDFYTELLTAEKPLEESNRAYFLRGRESQVARTLGELGAALISDEGVEQWLNAIRSSKHFVTNSFHGVVFCLIFHIPFTVVLRTKENIGMNDRFYTLLEPLSLTDRIFSEDQFCVDSIKCQFDWDAIDCQIERIRQTGYDFLKRIK